MFRSLTALALVAALTTRCHAEGPDVQLRGSGAALAAPSQGAPADGLPSLEHTDCGCSQAEGCECTRSGGAEADQEEHQAMEESLRNQTQELSAWWQEQGELARTLECSCAHGGESCACGAAAGTGGSGDAGAGEASGLVHEALRNETEQSLSLWWAVAGGGGGGWGSPGFRRCGRAGFGGCSCRWHGCRCGRAGFGGCRWR